MANWNDEYKVDLTAEFGAWALGTANFPETREKIVAKLKDSGWYKAKGSGRLGNCVKFMEESKSIGDFDHWFNVLHALADEDRAWIEKPNL